MGVNVFDVLQKVYGARGLPFPGHPKKGEGSSIGDRFEKPLPGEGSAIGGPLKYEGSKPNEVSESGTYIRNYDDEMLGQYLFLPARIDGYDLPNPIVIISGEKEIIETDVIEVGTVFEKVFIKPYDISIICTIIGEKGNWPEKELRQLVRRWEEKDVVSLRCALTDIFLHEYNNFIIKKISVLDNQGAENVEVIQIDGRSNIEFQLENV